MTFPDLITTRRQEAERRLRMLGACAYGELDREGIRRRAYEVRVPYKTLLQWALLFRKGGSALLEPAARQEFSASDQHKIADRYTRLGNLIDLEELFDEHIQAATEKAGWSRPTTDRWLRRHRIYGLWGLARVQNPESIKPKTPKRDLGSLTEGELKEVMRRRELLGNLTDAARVSTTAVERRASEVGVTARTVWNLLRAYRDSGLLGLIRRERSDKGMRHELSPQMTGIIEGLALGPHKLPLKEIQRRAIEKAETLGEPEPSFWQVRRICASIPRPVQLVAHGYKEEFNSMYRTTRTIIISGVCYQLDSTMVDVLVKDLRSPQNQRKSKMVRPWLTLCLDAESRLVVAARFSYDRPDRFIIAATIREALLQTPEYPYGGIPEEVRVDHGREMIAGYVEQFVRELGSRLHICNPHTPQQKGRVERFFGTLNTRLWATLPGYVGSSPDTRPPNVVAALTLSELDRLFRAWLDSYHHEVHSVTKKTPLAAWEEHGKVDPPDLRELDIFLQEPRVVKVLKEGVKYRGSYYWHGALGPLTGHKVLIRTAPDYDVPETIEVFRLSAASPNNGSAATPEDSTPPSVVTADDSAPRTWLCTAERRDSAIGRAVTAEEVTAAQREQRRVIREQIETARQNLTPKGIPANKKGAHPAPADSLPKHPTSPGKGQVSKQEQSPASEPPSAPPTAAENLLRIAAKMQERKEEA